MKSVQDEIMKFIQDKVNDTFDTDLGSDLAQKLHVISHLEPDANERKTRMSLLETQLVNFAQNQVFSYWCSRKGTKHRPSLFERLKPVLYHSEPEEESFLLRRNHSEPEEESWTSTNADDSYFEGASFTRS